MDFAAPHIGFVVASYAISAVALAGLVIAIVARYRATMRKLETLERQGAPRRAPAGAVRA